MGSNQPAKPVKPMKRQDELSTGVEILERVRAGIEGVWNALYEQPELQQQLVEMWPDIQMLASALHNTEGLLATALEVADDFKLQRDIALQEANWQKRRRPNGVIEEMARYISYDAKIPVKDVARVLSMLIGEIELPVSGYTLSDFYEALKGLADEAFIEEQIQEALED